VCLYVCLTYGYWLEIVGLQVAPNSCWLLESQELPMTGGQAKSSSFHCWLQRRQWPCSHDH
jgi:hypothetical protein